MHNENCQGRKKVLLIIKKKKRKQDLMRNPVKLNAVKFTCIPTKVSRKRFNLKSHKTKKKRGLEEEFDSVKRSLKEREIDFSCFCNQCFILKYLLYFFKTSNFLVKVDSFPTPRANNRLSITEERIRNQMSSSLNSTWTTLSMMLSRPTNIQQSDALKMEMAKKSHSGIPHCMVVEALSSWEECMASCSLSRENR